MGLLWGNPHELHRPGGKNTPKVNRFARGGLWVLVFVFFFAWFLGFLPGVTFSSFPAFLAWARGACVFLVANFLQIVFWLGFLPGVGAPGARQSFVFFGGFKVFFFFFCFFCVFFVFLIL